MGEPRVLGGREDPASALQLADPAQPLEPRGIEEVLLGDVLVGQPGGRRLGRRQPLGEFDVPVDRVADEVDGGERVPPHGWVARAPRYAPRLLHAPTLPRRSVARTRTEYVRPPDRFANGQRRRRRVVAEQHPRPVADPVLDVVVAQPGGVGLEPRVVAAPRPAHVVAGAGRAGSRAPTARVWSVVSVEHRRRRRSGRFDERYASPTPM